MFGKRTAITFLLCISVALGGCSTINRDSVSALVGAGAGVAVGSFFGGGAGQAAAMAAGGITGSLLGWFWSTELAPEDAARHDQTIRNALNSDMERMRLDWSNPKTDSSGWVKVQGQLAQNEGTTCRTYEHATIIDGNKQISKGIACIDAKGTWRIR